MLVPEFAGASAYKGKVISSFNADGNNGVPRLP